MPAELDCARLQICASCNVHHLLVEHLHNCHDVTQDLSNYNKNAVIIAKKYFNVADIDDYYKKTDAKPLIFCHFARGLGEKVYNEVTEFKDLYKTLMEVHAPEHYWTQLTDVYTAARVSKCTCLLLSKPTLCQPSIRASPSVLMMLSLAGSY